MSPDTRIPTLNATPVTSDQAALYQWLAYSKLAELSGWNFKGLAYQTLQTQGPSQAISIARGYLDNGWLHILKMKLGSKLTDDWQRILNYTQSELSFEIGYLMQALREHSQAAWINHLRDISICSLKKGQNNMRPYTVQEIREVTKLMTGTNNSIPLSAVLERKEGTLRIGRALRTLGQVNNVALLEIIHGLDTARTFEQMQRVAGLIGQHCNVNKAHHQTVIVPDRNDYQVLFDDMERYGQQKIANTLICLAYAWHPKIDKGNNETDPPQSSREKNFVDYKRTFSPTKKHRPLFRGKAKRSQGCPLRNANSDQLG